MTEQEGEQVLRIPGRLDADRAGAVEQALWEKMQFASHLRSPRLGEFTVGTTPTARSRSRWRSS